MFEAVVTLCATVLSNAPGEACREVLLPGYAAADRVACEDALRMSPPDWLNGFEERGPSCVPRPPSALTFIEVAPRVFVHAGQVAEPNEINGGDVSNIAFVLGTNSIAVIDAGGSRRIGEQVYLAIRAQSDLPISNLILTHMHPDHVFGAAPLREAGARVLGHAKLARGMSDRAASYEASFARLIGAAGFLGSRIIAPDRGVTQVETIDLGDRVLTLTPWPTGHTATDLTVMDGSSGLLFSGDLVFDDHAPALDGSLQGWHAVLDDLTALPAAQVVPGHGAPVLPWPASAAPLARYLDVLTTDTRDALTAGLPLSEAASVIGQSEAPHWQLFDLYNPRNATVAYTELEWE